MIRRSYPRISGPPAAPRRGAPVLEVSGLDVSHGDVQVIWDLSFSVGEGEIVALLGANGAGKSTTLKTISGLIHPSDGTIVFNGAAIEHLPPYEIVGLGIAQVPEGRRLWPGMTVLETLLLGAYQSETRERTAGLDRAFSLFPVLAERRRQLAGTLSGGEQQMLAIARALMARPRLLMLDEPSLGLAPKVVDRIFEVVLDVSRAGVTILLVEQNAHLALQVARRAYIVETGRLAVSGASADLLANVDVRRAYLGL
ncbi:MAG: ABC transporter ATP-binding protein [Gemmatimonadetes bacterium]|nr:ABC transporter ATP-binding protein [Gemmatimonadota bacterium]